MPAVWHNAPAQQVCHPERSEGPAFPAHQKQVLRFAQDDGYASRRSIEGPDDGEGAARNGLPLRFANPIRPSLDRFLLRGERGAAAAASSGVRVAPLPAALEQILKTVIERGAGEESGTLPVDQELEPVDVVDEIVRR